MLFLSSSFQQNYFGDPWNVLDFVIVVGSIVDIIAAQHLVSDFVLLYTLGAFILYVLWRPVTLVSDHTLSVRPVCV